MVYYFYFYLPAQPKPSLPLAHTQSTQTETSPDPQIAQLETALAQKEQTIQELTHSHQVKIRELQAQIRDLVKKPPTSSKSTQTQDHLAPALDKFIKEVRELNNILC